MDAAPIARDSERSGSARRRLLQLICSCSEVVSVAAHEKVEVSRHLVTNWQCTCHESLWRMLHSLVRLETIEFECRMIFA